MGAKPIRLRQIDAAEYDGLPQRELLVVGDMPGGGEAAEVAWADVTGKPTSFPPSTHTHTVANVTGLQDALDGKQAAGSYAAASHTHTVANVTGLQDALDGKQAAGSYAEASHTHTVANVTGLQGIIDDLTQRLEALETETP